MSDQPAPKPAHGDVWLDVIESNPLPASLRIECILRRQLGIDRYNTPLQLDNGRDMRRDAREEALDLAVYLWALSLMSARDGRWLAALGWRWVSRAALVLAWGLR